VRRLFVQSINTGADNTTSVRLRRHSFAGRATTLKAKKSGIRTTYLRTKRLYELDVLLSRQFWVERHRAHLGRRADLDRSDLFVGRSSHIHSYCGAKCHGEDVTAGVVELITSLILCAC
jgi:hypothetical protein